MGLGAAIGGIAGGIIGNKGAKDASKAQEQAAREQLALETRIYDENVERFQPFYGIGLDAQNALAFELGLADRPTFGGDPQQVVEFQDTQPSKGLQPFTYEGGQREGIVGFKDAGPVTTTRYRVGEQVFDSREAADEYAAANPTGGTEYGGFKATPGYQFNLDQGLAAIDNSAASRGNVFSGATMKAAQQFGTGLANQEYNNFLNRLTGQASSGQAAAGNQATAGSNFAAGAGNALSGIGNAQSAGAIGSANAINAGINNAIGGFNYQNQLANANKAQSGVGGLFSLFTGSAPGSANSLGLS